MKSTAAGLAALGRGPDTMLIHMSPREVDGLQQLAMAHGGSLTTNPHTGLPEAGFLSDILPAVVGVGLTMMGMPAWGVGLGSGLTSLATGKDAGSALMSGLLAGGGAALFGPGSALEIGAGAAPASAAGMAGTGVGSSAANLTLQGAQGLTGGSGALLSPELINAGGAALPTAAKSSSALLSPNLMQAAGNAFSGLPLPAAGAAGSNALLTSGITGGATGMPGVAATPSFLDKSLAWAKANPMMAAGVGAAGLGALGGFEQPGLQMLPGQERSNVKLAQGFQRQGQFDRPDEEGYYFSDRGILSRNPITYAAKGGEMHSVPQLEDGGFVLTKKAVDGLGKGSNDRGQRAAATGLGAIPIKGPGTGTSDSIATSIDGVRPAKVSNGEAYVPQKRVKQAGGAKKLYALMRKAENDARRRAA